VDLAEAWNALPFADSAPRRSETPLWKGIVAQFKGPIPLNDVGG
jgi:hypothetical protein